MANTLVSIGYLGGFRVYLNVPLEEAKRRFQEEMGEDPAEQTVQEFTFDDVFYAYEVGPIEDSIMTERK